MTAECVMRTSSLGSQVVCAQCGDECECYVCTHDEGCECMLCHMTPISSGHFSFDMQVSDALDHLFNHHGDNPDAVRVVEGNPIGFVTWSGSWVDTEASDVDPEFMSWICDEIEATGIVSWDDGEPYCHECD